MNNNYLFHGKRLDNGEWVFGYPVCCGNIAQIGTFNVMPFGIQIGNGYAVDPIREAGGCRCGECKRYSEFRTKRNKQLMRLCCRMGKNDMEYSVKPGGFCSDGEPREVKNDG